MLSLALDKKRNQIVNFDLKNINVFLLLAIPLMTLIYSNIYVILSLYLLSFSIFIIDSMKKKTFYSE